MNIGIVTAFGKESKLLRSRLPETGRERIDDFTFFLHRYEDDDVIVVRTGPGQSRGSMGTNLLIDRFDTSLVLNSGVAGAIAPHRRPGDVVISERIIEYHRSESGWLVEAIYFPDPGLLETALKISGSLFLRENAVAGVVLSGDDIVDSETIRESLWDRFRGECVEMEGAGVAAACQAHRLPWIGIRGISDRADERVLQDFSANVEFATLHCNNLIFELIKNGAGRFGIKLQEESTVRPEAAGPTTPSCRQSV